jgi:hypothetical protein
VIRRTWRWTPVHSTVSTFPNVQTSFPWPRLPFHPSPSKPFCNSLLLASFPPDSSSIHLTTRHAPQSTVTYSRRRKMSFTTKFSATLCLTLVLAAGRRALAVNDWSVPCTQGKCSWDLPADSSASGALHIVSLCFTCAKHVAFHGHFADAIYLHTLSGVLPARFRTLPLLLDGKLLQTATRVPQRKKSSSCARTAIQTVTTSFKVEAQ